MATKKTTDKSDDKKAKAAPKKAASKKAAPKAKAAATKVAKAPKAPREKTEPALPRHPKARLAKLHDSKESLAKSLAKSLVAEGEDEGTVADRLRVASNSQLLRLSHVVETVQQKYGSRAKLIEAIGTAEKKSTDKDYLARLQTFSLPRLLDLAASHERRTRAHA